MSFSASLDLNMVGGRIQKIFREEFMEDFDQSFMEPSGDDVSMRFLKDFQYDERISFRFDFRIMKHGLVCLEADFANLLDPLTEFEKINSFNMKTDRAFSMCLNKDSSVCLRRYSLSKTISEMEKEVRGFLDSFKKDFDDIEKVLVSDCHHHHEDE